MSPYEEFVTGLAVLSFITSIIALYMSSVSAKKTRTNDAMVLLHESWKDIQEFEANDPYTDSAIEGANALKLTAAIWMDRGVNQKLIYDVFGPRYSQIYTELLVHTDNLPDVSYSGKDLLTESVRLVFADISSLRST